MKNYLNFETDIKNLEEELEKLKDPYNQEGLSEVDTSKISKVEQEINEKLEKIYSNLDPWQTADSIIISLIPAASLAALNALGLIIISR